MPMPDSNTPAPTFANFTLKQTLSGSLSWFFQLCKCALRRNRRFLAVTPPPFATRVLYDFDNKSFFKVRIRDWVDYGAVIQIFNNHDYSLRKLKRNIDIEKFYKTLVANGKTPLIIDCGGHIGLASRYFADTYPEAKIVCIEPEHANFTQAQLNNQGKNVVFREAAVGSEESKGSVLNTQRGSSAFQVSVTEGGSLDILSINKLLELYASDDVVPFIIKIDIEGFEKDLFSKNTDWVERFPVLIIELHDWMLPRKANSVNFLNVISKLNRDFVHFGRKRIQHFKRKDLSS